MRTADIAVLRGLAAVRLAVVLAAFGLDGAAGREPLGLAIQIVLAVAVWFRAGRVQGLVARWPVLLLLDAALGALVLWRLHAPFPFVWATLSTTAAAGAFVPWGWLLLVCSAQIVACRLLVSVLRPDDVRLALWLPLLYPLASVAGIGVRWLLVRYAETEQESAAAEERARLAREMHDSLGKTLVGAALSAETLPLWIRTSPERAEAEAERIAAALRAANAEARGLIAGLRAETEPLDRALRELAARWTRVTGIAVDVRTDEPPEPPPDVRAELIAIAGEALTNVARHADARRVRLALSASGLVVADDGRGFVPEDGVPDGHYGLIGMAERAVRAGCGFAVTSAPGRGTAITVTFPEGWA
ncbi:sensor histidine kinase [Actinomadura rupiterrae]|uniref:sensor histidine kinase n=1 Tax=Actinomadura rupiterrae TaxID=559627 RepID=UPI0020A3FFF1|nr:sensor histidine kinase [Actinomadura rupiterrae]MCP2343029.1 signal transduction histidine kinase [Actinomadura rupiterrae]